MKLKNEFELTKNCVLLVTKNNSLMENDPNIKTVKTLRNDLVLSL
jgi:phosphoenolpyruvate carboxylase